MNQNEQQPENEYCDNCGTSDKDQALVRHSEYQWCLDCMRVTGHCITCDCYMPELIEDFFNYEDDVCIECNEKYTNHGK